MQSSDPGMTQPPAQPPAAPERINLLYHLIIGAAVGVTSAFTALAWPVAMFVGYIVGRDQVERMHGIRAGFAVNMLRALGIVVGFGFMLFLGAFVGGLIALIIVALVAFSERVAANASATEQGIARILVFMLGAVIWIVFFFVFKPNINVSIGG